MWIIMYQDFGARELDETKRIRFRLFIPDNALNKNQYQFGHLPPIAQLHVIGDFQAHFGKPNWSPDPLFELGKSQFTDPDDGLTKGWLYELKTGPVPDGFYEYKFHVTYTDGATRVICDPCTRYG